MGEIQSGRNREIKGWDREHVRLTKLIDRLNRSETSESFASKIQGKAKGCVRFNKKVKKTA